MPHHTADRGGNDEERGEKRAMGIVESAAENLVVIAVNQTLHNSVGTVSPLVRPVILATRQAQDDSHYS